MGSHPNIDIDRFPKQGSFAGTPVRVCFNYDTSRTMDGVCVRDDADEPGIMIIRLADGRHVLATECMWTLISEPGREVAP